MNQSRIYLAIGISLDRVRVVFWSPTSEKNPLDSLAKTNFLASGGEEPFLGEEDFLTAVEVSYKNAWSLLPDELANLADRAEVIFSVPQSWVDDNNQIETAKSELLKKVLSRLHSRALGFFPEGELLLDFFANQGDSLPSLVALDVGEDKIAVFPLVRGKILGVSLVERSNSLALDLEEGLARFNFDQAFPPRILLLGSDNLAEERDNLLSHSWLEPGKNFFMHLPKVEIFDYQQIFSTLTGQAKEFTPDDSDELSGDWSESSAELSAPVDDQTVANQTLGFVKNKDIANEPVSEPLFLKKADQITNFSASDQDQGVETSNRVNLRQSPQNLLANIGARIKRLGIFHRDAPRGEGQKRSLPKPILILLIIIGLVLGGLFLAWWYLPKATLTLSVVPRLLEDNISLLVSANTDQTDIDEKIIPAHEVTVSTQAEGSISTTGEDLVGEKATGQVVIYNRTEIAKTFAAGTILASESGLEFLLDEEVSLEAAQIDIDDDYNQTITASKQTVKVTAGEIGADYNLASGEEFSIDDFIKTDFVAKNEADFSGGSSREVRVVAEDDIVSLREEVSQLAKNKGEEELTKQSSSTEKLISESLSFDSTQESFSHQAGDEADQLSLAITTTISGLAYYQEDLDWLIESLLADQIPSGFKLGEEKTANFKFVDEDDDGFWFSLSFGASLYPDIDESAVKEKIAGRRPEAVKDYLSLLPSVNDFEISLVPNLPDFLLTLPHKTDNITIEMKVD